MKKKIILSILSLVLILSCITGCSKSKSYNDVSRDDRPTSKDSRQLDNGELPSNFELVSCEDVDRCLKLYIVRDRQNNQEYIISIEDSATSNSTIAITPRIKNDSLNK